eukprot:TRINITY_DN8786_c0_g1_i1.p1 TRINITY_DN8786_c0_g1~~TRINITY_DN8786_c0_g1_i1.p1  ORF type:complete len:286 (+),score=91.26 TRINITY_DN8786_c0_g1_i1:38-859(+)
MSAHSHPLTHVTGATFKCDVCASSHSGEDTYRCTRCNFDECANCHVKHASPSSPTPKSSSPSTSQKEAPKRPSNAHPHPLELKYDRSYRCDVCRKNCNSTTSHTCSRCGYDECMKCYATRYGQTKEEKEAEEKQIAEHDATQKKEKEEEAAKRKKEKEEREKKEKQAEEKEAKDKADAKRLLAAEPSRARTAVYVHTMKAWKIEVAKEISALRLAGFTLLTSHIASDDSVIMYWQHANLSGAKQIEMTDAFAARQEDLHSRSTENFNHNLQVA